jgi:hypothetical protein
LPVPAVAVAAARVRAVPSTACRAEDAAAEGAGARRAPGEECGKNGRVRHESPVFRGKNNNSRPPALSWAIAAGAVFGYNLQPNQSSSQRFLGASAFIWLEIQKDGQMPIFFLLNWFFALEKCGAAV